MRAALRAVAAGAALALFCAGALGQGTAKKPPDPLAILAASKDAAGGSAWDGLSFQHTLVGILSGGQTGEVERWTDIQSGRSMLRFVLGAMSGKLGFDGTTGWSQEPSGKVVSATDEVEAQLAVNAAYRDQLAFWFPERREATVTYKRRSIADGAEFDVVTIIPKGGREFEFWVNIETKLIERLVEREATVTRTEYYMDWQDVQGAKIPFRVRASRGAPRADEIVVVERIEFNGPHQGVDLARPASP